MIPSGQKLKEDEAELWCKDCQKSKLKVKFCPSNPGTKIDKQSKEGKYQQIVRMEQKDKPLNNFYAYIPYLKNGSTTF